VSTSSFGSDGEFPPLPPELDPRGRRHAKQAAGGTGRRSAIRTAQVLATVLAVLSLTGFGYGWWTYRKLNNNLQRLQVSVGNTQNTAPGTTTHKDIDGKDQNLLIAGNDDRNDMTNAEVKELHTGRDGGSEATDTMMIVHIPANGAKATLISLPRDSWVNIPGYGMNKLNAAYALAYAHASGSENAKRAAGADLLLKTVHNLTGLTIDHFVQVDLIGFFRISQAIGGVSVNMCNSVNDTVAYNEAHGQGDAGSGLVISKGKHTLTPLQTLEFVRQRHNLAGGDLDRVKRQRYFLTAAFRKITSAGTLLNPSRLSKLVSAVDKSIYVDQNLNLTTLAEQMTNLNANNIAGETIPTTPGYAGTTSILVVNPSTVKTFVSKLIKGTSSALSKAKAVAPSSVMVDVINGGTVDHAATQNAAVLTQAGFHATVDQKSATSSTTVIEYASGMEAQAKTVGLYVPGATYQQVNTVAEVTLVLGADGHTAKSTPTAASTTKPKTKAIDSGCIN
jgi:LCP family protein required for cell wall assembly